MNLPRQTAAIFEILSKGQFICSNSVDAQKRKLFDVLDDKDNFEQLFDYFKAINFILEKGDEFYYFSRKNESKVDMERKLETAYKWIDMVDFFKSYNSAFGVGFSFSPAEIVVQIKVNALLKSKANELKNSLRMKDPITYEEVAQKLIDQLCKDGFAEQEGEVLKSYKVLSSFKFLEELIMNIHIPEEVQNEIP